MKIRKFLAVLLSCIMVCSMCACGEKDTVVVSFPGSSSVSLGQDTSAENTDSSQTSIETGEEPEYITQTVISNLKKSDQYHDYITDKEYSEIVCDKTSATTSAQGVTVGDGSITISAEGVYLLTGNFLGTVTVEASEDEKVVLILNNVTISGQNGPAIYVKKCDKVTVLLPEGTVNELSDASDYADTSDKGPTGCIYSKSDLSIAGTGSLTVTANYKDGIVSKDDLVITGGNITVSAEDDGILGKDSLVITDGTFNITAKGHGLKTSNDEDTEKGYAQIVGGNFNINVETDGINAVNSLVIENADITVSAGDDGLHADNSLTINSGKITISKSNEGIESRHIYIYGGEISVVASDDGVNANGEESGMMGFGGGKNKSNSNTTTSTTDTAILSINGGYLLINAKGDGLDSNGKITMTGGYVYVSGPTEQMNNATDYADTFVMTGGTIIATGSSGMYQSISAGSTCGSIDYLSNSTISAGKKCTLSNASGEILSFEIQKNCDAILIAGSCITAGETYTLKIGDNSEEVTANEGGSYQGFSFGGKGGFGGMGGFGGQNRPSGDGTQGNSFGDGTMTPPDGMTLPDGVTPPDGTTPPDGMTLPEGMTPPEDFESSSSGDFGGGFGGGNGFGGPGNGSSGNGTQNNNGNGTNSGESSGL